MKNISTSILLLFIGISLLVFAGCKKDDPLPEESMYDLLQQTPEYSIFKESIERAGFADELDGPNQITLFVPTNTELEKYYASLGYEDVSEIPVDFLEHLMNYHANAGKAEIDAFGNGYFVSPCTNTPDGDNLIILLEEINGRRIINGDAEVVNPNIEASNGYIHEINKVLNMPNLIELLEDNPNFSIFLEALKMTQFDNPLANQGPYTVFVPLNTAFDNYFKLYSDKDSLHHFSPEELENIVRYHILPGNINSSVFADNFFAENYATLKLGDSLKISPPTTFITINDTISSLFLNIQTTNGILHFIDGVLEPK